MGATTRAHASTNLKPAKYLLPKSQSFTPTKISRYTVYIATHVRAHFHFDNSLAHCAPEPLRYALQNRGGVGTHNHHTYMKYM